MNSESSKTALIIGAGPAGLTAALELLRRSDIRPIVLEADECVGGISRTVNHAGYRIDIGGHRFFSKSDWVMDWWREILPVDAASGEAVAISYHNKSRTVIGDGSAGDRVLMVRNRLSRIYFLRRFFDYPLKLTPATVRNLGFWRMARIGASYAKARFFPLRQERSLEDFLINRFGRELYLTFFKDYTEKVWGMPCHMISAEWGAQRIKGLSVSKALLHALSKFMPFGGDVKQKNTSTSLIERFLYPKFGPGQMWEEVARKVREGGGQILFGHQAVNFRLADGRIKGVTARNKTNGESIYFAADYVFSSMPVRDLILGMEGPVPEPVREVARGLPYRDFITVGLLVSEMKSNAQSRSTASNHMPPDNWIYIQERDVKLGRLQIFNNWSPAMVADPGKIWLGLEYFCNEGDSLWSLDDEALKSLGQEELKKIGLIEHGTVLDAIVIRIPKAYPAYFGSYGRFEEIRHFVDGIENLFLVGRNGMHRYNNQDHSMLTARMAVDNILAGITDKSNIWSVNIDDEYHEQK